MIRSVAVAAVLVSLALPACGGSDADSPATTSASPAAEGDGGAGGGTANAPEKSSGADAEGETGAGVEIKVADSQYGSVLFDGSDRAIYFFDKETSSRPACYGACAEAWPPVLTRGEPVARDGADASLLGTTKRQDGSMQATYDGRPLYYYVDDPVGQVLCHNVEEFGGVWLAVQPGGAPVKSS